MKVLDFDSALNYPFNRAKGLLNIFWLFLPIIGWFALGGYSIRITKGFINNRFKRLPIFSFKSDFKLGFFMFFKALPFMFVYILILGFLSAIHFGLRLVTLPFEVLFLPILFIHFMHKESVGSLFEFKILKSIKQYPGDFFSAFAKDFVLAILFFFAIIILVGLPAGAFTKNIFLADFYRRNIK